MGQGLGWGHLNFGGESGRGWEGEGCWTEGCGGRFVAF